MSRKLTPVDYLRAECIALRDDNEKLAELTETQAALITANAEARAEEMRAIIGAAQALRAGLTAQALAMLESVANPALIHQTDSAFAIVDSALEEIVNP